MVLYSFEILPSRRETVSNSELPLSPPKKIATKPENSFCLDTLSVVLGFYKRL